MAICLKCNTYNNAGKLYCKKCEAILPVEGENMCPKCQVPNGPFAKVCHQCGLALKRQQMEPATMTAAAAPKQTADHSNVTSMSSYKKKKAVKKIRTSLKPRKPIGKTIVIAVLALLFIIGVIATVTS